jgi:short-subunit dehydrogenase
LKLANRKSSNKKIKGKIVLITGSSSGIGRQAAIDLAENGAQTIILASRSKSKLEELERRIGSDFSSEVLVYPIDVSKEEDVIRMGREILDKFKYIDILVNNAGFGIYNKVQDQQIEEIKSIIFTNYLGMVYCVKVFLDSMIERRSGHIINVASVAASFGVAGLASYCASKYAMMGFSESLYHELYGSGVRVTVVSPIGVKTNFFNNESFHRHTPNYMGFMLEPKKVSKAILAAANSHRLEIMVPFYVRAGVWFKHTLPYAINPLVGYLFRKQLNKSKNEKK